RPGQLHSTRTPDASARFAGVGRNRCDRLSLPVAIDATPAAERARPAARGGDHRRGPKPVQSLGERSQRMKIVIPDDYPSVYNGRPDLDRLKALCDVEHHTTRPAGQDELRQRLAEADASINVRSYCIFDRALLDT